MARERAERAAKPVERRPRRSCLTPLERAAQAETTPAAAAAGETVGQRIRRLRLERGLSQNQLAGPGVCSAHVCAIETGHRQAALQALRVIAARLGVIPELLETGRSQTISDHLAQVALRRTDGALWIVLTPAGVTFTWQEAGERYQLDRPGDNLTEGLLALAEVAEELTRLDAAEAEAQLRRRQILQQRRAPE
jgi:transcriptional regulator with XRE-family HTH domain